MDLKKILSKNPKFFIAILIIIAAGSAYGIYRYGHDVRSSGMVKAADFSRGGTLEEADKMKDSSDEFWWLNSGGIMTFENGISKTNEGELPEGSKWQKLYAKTNPTDTDNGYHPQNIFRLVNRQKWQNFSQTLYFNIDKLDLSGSQNRNESNGVLLFNRYQDGDNLYYTGVRVDGYAVIKKKIDGKYYTLGLENIFAGRKKYNRGKNPNFLPLNQWIGIRSELTNIDAGTVNIKLYVDKENNGNWQLVLEEKDNGNEYGKAPFLREGYAGIRTDFMDVEFKNYDVQPS